MHTSASEEDMTIPRSIVSGRVARLRLLSGLLQGALLYALYYAAKNAVWPANSGYLFAPLLLAFLFVPLLFVSALGHLDIRRLWKWMLVAIAICIALGVHDVWRMDFAGHWRDDSSGPGRFMPSGWMVAFAAAGFFIAHALVLAAAYDGKRIAAYATYFEVAWKLGIQLMFSVLFVGVLWLILWLGASLFMLVKLNFLRTLLEQSWFVIPVLAFALSTALHVTDVRPRIVRGIRNLLLVLMSWLLPISTLIVGGFLLTLPFVGLEPLWATRHATSVLLGSAAVLIVLINAAFQSGEATPDVARVLRMAARVACALLLPLAVIALYALALRVQQYGWSADRIKAAACLLVASCYAAGYLWAACERGSWLARVAQTNVVSAVLVLLILLSLFTPLADPARLSVHSQLARLDAGKMPIATFDFHYLRFDGARYGNAALQALKTRTDGADAEVMRKQAESALAKINKWDRADHRPLANAQSRAANISVSPQGRNLPADFLQQDWSKDDKTYTIPDCLRHEDKKCEAYLLDMSGDGQEDVLVRDDDRGRQLILFAKKANGTWDSIGAFDTGYGCKDILQGLQDGRYRAAAPRFHDLEVAGRHLHLQPWVGERSNCER